MLTAKAKHAKATTEAEKNRMSCMDSLRKKSKLWKENDAKAFVSLILSQLTKVNCNKYILELLVFIYCSSLQ
jgi:hypothetical protein